MDAKCPKALVKNSAEDEVEINVDVISPKIFDELLSYVRGCSGDNGGANGKKKKGGTKRSRP